MMRIKELENKWNAIDSYSGGYLLISGDHSLSFHIGYRRDDQKSFVVLNIGKMVSLKSSKAITAECIEEDNRFTLRFTLNYPSLDEIFVKLCWDLMESSKGSQNPAEQICIQYSKWMRLLQKATEDILSPSRQKGLIGELLYLQGMLNKLGPTEVISAWVGPEGCDQDFIFTHFWAEIKAVTVAATDVQISSLQQLTQEEMGYLVVYFMDKTTSTGLQTISLPGLIRQVEERLTSTFLRDSFHCKIAQYGYLSRDEKKYMSTYYRLSEYRKYEVMEDFPKLTRKNVPDAIVNTKYRLDLLMLEKWKI